MKFLIVLAAILLIPIVMKLQQKSYLERSVPKVTAQVENFLQQQGVASPTVSVDYLNVSISGFVESEATANAFGKEVERMRGVSGVQNGLVARGWLEVSRKDGKLVAQGAVPPSWPKEIFREQQEADLSKLKVRKAISMEGIREVALGLFIDQFFQGSGERSLKLAGERIVISGEATPTQADQFAQLLKPFEQTLQIESQLKRYPSEFHFKSRTTTSAIAGEARRSLAQLLANKTIAFEDGKTVFSSNGRETLNEWASLLFQDKYMSDVQFVLGGHPDSSGTRLANNRALAVQKVMIEGGVDPSQLEVVTFDMTDEESGFPGQVELLIR